MHRRSTLKREQHASPGGHLLSQVCSPNVIKIGATPAERRRAGTPTPWVLGHGCETRGTVVLFWGRWKRWWEFEWKWKGASGGEKKKTGFARKFARQLFRETQVFGRMGLFWAHADYPLLIDAGSERQGSHEKKETGGSHTHANVILKNSREPKWAKCSVEKDWMVWKENYSPPEKPIGYMWAAVFGRTNTDGTQSYNGPASMATRGGIAFPYTTRPLHALM